MPPCRHSPPLPDSCHLCRLDRDCPHHRALFASLESAGVPLEVIRPPCRYEGPIRQWASCGCEGRHVRDCERFDLCTRAPNNGSVASCSNCPHHTPAV
jgi:hypothetical protein